MKDNIRSWGRELGFDAVGFAGVDVREAGERLQAWLAAGQHGQMHYMAAHGNKRTQPEALVPGTCSIIVARMSYLTTAQQATSSRPQQAVLARYAWGRDYHRVVRRRLARLAMRIQAQQPEAICRVFTDSAPVMEVELARQAGLGWRGKNTLLIDRHHGSWFFLGEIFCSLPFPPDTPTTDHCGSCSACIKACPTGALTSAYHLDARRCIAYWTIEYEGAFPESWQSALGNRIYGCDDCQNCCPWNRKVPLSTHADFAPRHQLDRSDLLDLWQWTRHDFETRLAGSAIRRIGYARWRRNLAAALTNADSPNTLS